MHMARADPGLALSRVTVTRSPSSLGPALEAIFQSVLRRSPAEPEFHQAVREVLETIGPAVSQHPEYMRQKLLERIAEPWRPHRTLACLYLWESLDNAPDE